MYFRQFTQTSVMTVPFDAMRVFCSETSLNSLKVGAHFQSCTNICHYVALKPSTLPAFLESRHDDDDDCDNKVIAHAFHFWTIDF